ncbi:peptidoglycan-binding protein [Streptomyces sp. NPDC101115]|uniref:peptidoglycan-binding domain-containing protein n=1 Tax=Streptomyces sp. NPDC101115 TaxID=3366106 RepID=UPI0037FF3122
MRPSILTRSIVSVTAVVGLAAGTLATAGTSFAASAPASQLAAVSAGGFGTLATYNFGLSGAQASRVQDWLQAWGYTGALDGQLGTNSWKAFQKCLAAHWAYTDPIDGIPGTDTVKALQRMLKAKWGYTGAIDGIAGDGTKAALKRLADKAPRLTCVNGAY